MSVRYRPDPDARRRLLAERRAAAAAGPPRDRRGLWLALLALSVPAGGWLLVAAFGENGLVMIAALFAAMLIGIKRWLERRAG
jgi:hypothetical protein